MRKRNLKINIFLNAEEKKIFDGKVQKSGLNKSEFFRKIILGYRLKEQPDERFYEILKQLRGMANNLNQMAKVYNANFGYVPDYNIESLFKSIKNLILDLQEKFILPEKKGATNGNNKTMEIQKQT